MILTEDFHVNAEKLHEIDYGKRLNINEASLILGFIIKYGIDFSMPECLTSDNTGQIY